jgi:hypothetical protein
VKITIKELKSVIKEALKEWSGPQGKGNVPLPAIGSPQDVTQQKKAASEIERTADRPVKPTKTHELQEVVPEQPGVSSKMVCLVAPYQDYGTPLLNRKETKVFTNKAKALDYLKLAEKIYREDYDGFTLAEITFIE